MKNSKIIAAVGTDGSSLVVWGIGTTHEEADHDAKLNGEDAGCDPEVCGFVTLTEEQAELVAGGTVHLDSLGVKYRYHNGALTEA